MSNNTRPKPVIRRATEADYDSVVDLVKDVDAPADYLPSLYHEYLRDGRHALYVAEVPGDHTLVHVSNCRLPSVAHPETCTLLSARTRRNAQGTGALHAVKLQILRDFPAVNRFIGTFTLGPTSIARLYRSTIQFEWIYLEYDITQRCLETLQLPAVSYSSSSKAVQCLSSSESAQLIRNEICQQFLNRFTSQYIPSCHVSAIPFRLDSKADLIEMMTKVSGNTLVTYSKDDSVDAKSIAGMSFSSSTALLAERRHFSMHFNVLYFGAAVGDLMKHMEAQLRYASTMHRDHNVFYVMGFPESFDPVSISQQFLANLVPSAKVLSTQRAFLATENVQYLKHKL